MALIIDIVGGLTIALIFLFVGLTIGFATSRASKLAIFGVALFAGSLVWLGSLLFSAYLITIPFFVDYASMIVSVIGSPFVFGSQLLTAIFSLIGLLEIGYLVGCAAVSVKTSRTVITSLEGGGITRYQRLGALSGAAPGRNSIDDSIAMPLRSENRAFEDATPSRTPKQAAVLQAPASAAQYLTRSTNLKQLGSTLSEDEKTLASLFVFNKVREVSPKLDDLSPDGYTYEQLKYLDWGTARETQALNSLTLRNYLVATPREKTLKCRECGSMHLQVRSQCPECGSLGAERHKVLEHFPCGMIDREENFRAENGDLVCPKCNKRLELIGMDYRSLGAMFVCQSCGALNKELATSLKCPKCGYVARPEEESEVYLFAYALNPATGTKLKQYVKPVQTVANFFDSSGYTVFTPAMVRGKSGTEHTFDMLVLDRTALRSQIPTPSPGASSQNGEVGKRMKLIVEILVSDVPIKLEEVTTVYGKINDVSYQSVLIAIPSLADNARSYAAAYGMKVVEAPNVDAAVSMLSATIGPLRGASSAVRRATTLPSPSAGAE